MKYIAQLIKKILQEEVIEYGPFILNLLMMFDYFYLQFRILFAIQEWFL